MIPPQRPTDAAAPARPFWAWALFDFANSAFSAVVITFVFSVYFKNQVVADPHTGAVLWGIALGVSGLVVVLVAPFLGMAIDRDRARGPTVLLMLTALAVAGTLMLAMAQPQATLPVLVLVGVGLVVANAAFELGLLIVNATLSDVSNPKDQGKRSGYAWGLGYAGGVVSLGLVMIVLIGVGGMPPLIALDPDTGGPVRAALVLTACWFAVFATPFLLAIRRIPRAPVQTNQALTLRDLARSVREIVRDPPLFRFFLGSALVRDGLTTLFAVGAIYASTVVGLTPAEIIIFGIGMNITAAMGAVLFGVLDDRMGSKPVVLAALGCLIVFSVALLVARDPVVFIGIALALGMFVGPVQASLRVWLNRITPPDRVYSHFGFYALSGRAVSVVGPFLYAGVLAVTGSAVAALATIPCVWILAWPLLHWCDEHARPDSSHALAQLE